MLLYRRNISGGMRNSSESSLLVEAYSLPHSIFPDLTKLGGSTQFYPVRPSVRLSVRHRFWSNIVVLYFLFSFFFIFYFFFFFFFLFSFSSLLAMSQRSWVRNPCDHFFQIRFFFFLSFSFFIFTRDVPEVVGSKPV